MRVPNSISPELCQGKRFFVRADCNIPLHRDNQHLHDYRLRALLPTIDLIINHGGKVIIGTHLGRPPALSRTHYFDESLSTAQLVPWFEQMGYKIRYEVDLMRAIEESKGSFETLLLLENLRFFNGEHQQSDDFAKLLAQCADYYVNDAFGMLHRNDTSITLLPEQFPPKKRLWGLLMEKECSYLDILKKALPRPFTLLIGGSKVKNKLSWLAQLVTSDKSQRPDSILVAGLTALAFQQEYTTPAISEHDQELANHIATICQEQEIALHLPSDFLVLNHEKSQETSLITNPLEAHDRKIVDIGPSTIKDYVELMKASNLLLMAGTAGYYEQEYGQHGTQGLLQAIAAHKGTTIVGGGDTVAALITFGCDNAISFLSTGGGSLLAYFASSAPYKELPGLKPLLK